MTASTRAGSPGRRADLCRWTRREGRSCGAPLDLGEPGMGGVCDLERPPKPRAALRLQPGQRRLEIAPVLVLVRVLGLEEQNDLRPAVGDAVGSPLDQLRVREPDRGIAPADPGIAVGGLAEDVEAP